MKRFTVIALGILFFVLGFLATAQESATTTRTREPSAMLAPEQSGILLLEARQALEEPDRTLDFMGLRDGDLVADMGCGNGYYSLRMAERVGPHGVVFAVDVQQGMLDQLTARMAEGDVRNVYPILGDFDDPKLPSGKMDWMILVDAYHEFGEPEIMLARMKEALAPGGRIALLEYRLEQDPATIPFPIPPAHKMSIEQVLGEWKPAGFELIQIAEFLPAQHLFIFKNAEDDTRPEIHPLAYGDITNLATFDNVVYFGSQPAEDDIQRLADLGIKTVINLRTEEEMHALEFDEKAAVESLSMTYVHAPMGRELLGASAWNTLRDALATAEANGPVLLHCRSGNRVGAVWAAYARETDHLSPDDAIEEGRAAGMKAPAFVDALRERFGK